MDKGKNNISILYDLLYLYNGILYYCKNYFILKNILNLKKKQLLYFNFYFQFFIKIILKF